MTSLQPRIQRQMWVVDEKYHHIYTVAAQIGLPAAIVLALFDKHYPAECFGTLSESEWEVVLEGTGMEGRSSEIFQLIEQWKQAAKIGPDQSIIPPLEANAYVFQIKGDDEETDPEEQNIPNHSNLSQVDEENESSKDVKDQVNQKNLSGEADDGTMSVKIERLVENPPKEVQPVVDLQASDDSEIEDNCTSAASAKSVEPTTSSAAMVPSGVLQQRCEQVQNVANILFFSPDDLSALLAKTEIGLAIVQSSSNGLLSKDSKRDLLSIIANYHILCHSQENNCRLTKAVLENYVHCIKLRFPAETEDMVTYYIPAAPPERKNPGGSIYQAYKRLKGAKRDRQRRELQHAAKLATKENNRSPQRAEQSEANRWLTLNNAPWETVMKMWKITESSRFEQMKSLKPTEIITKFRHYVEPLGYQLVSNFVNKKTPFYGADTLSWR